MAGSPLRAFVAGVLIANSAPHMVTAVALKHHRTPLAGRNSGPAVNAVWAALNLATGLALMSRSRQQGETRWGTDLLAFESGYLAFAGWMAGSERIQRVNWSSERSADRL